MIVKFAESLHFVSAMDGHKKGGTPSAKKPSFFEKIFSNIIPSSARNLSGPQTQSNFGPKIDSKNSTDDSLKSTATQKNSAGIGGTVAGIACGSKKRRRHKKKSYDIAKSSIKVEHTEKLKAHLPPSVGKIFRADGISVLEFLGSGSYAMVYKVRDKNGKLRAVKVIDSSYQKVSADYRLKFMRRELEILQRVHHDNIIKIYEIKKKGDIVIIYMEYAAGGTLTDQLKDGPIPEPRAKELFRKICRGVEYMHNNRVAHRDLKLENILLDARGTPKLTDFSYAVVCTAPSGGQFLSRTWCGSLVYMAPGIE